jgi:hypothetical protein
MKIRDWVVYMIYLDLKWEVVVIRRCFLVPMVILVGMVEVEMVLVFFVSEKGGEGRKLSTRRGVHASLSG